MEKIDIAREYRTRYGSEMPTLKLARILYEDHKLTFKDVEDARSGLRYIEGKLGAKKRKQLADKSLIMEGERTKSPYNLPKSDEEGYEIFNITEGKDYKKGFIMNDIHLPYHNLQALEAAIAFAEEEKPDFIFLNGDIVDFHAVSYFQKDPRKKRFSEELDMLKDFVEELNRIFKCKIYYKFGKHEERYDSFLFQKAHELVGVDEFNLEALVLKRCPDVTVIKEKRIVSIAGLPFIHGHEFGRAIFSPVNAARGLFLQAKHSCVKGDCHTTSSHSERDILGKISTTHSIGALCGLTPKWLPLNKWNAGFAMIDIIGDNSYRFRNYQIIDGKVV